MNLFILKMKKVESFYPLHFFRKISDLRTGILNASERFSAIYGTASVYIERIPKKMTEGIYLYENFITYEKLNLDHNAVLLNNGKTVGYFISKSTDKGKIRESIEVKGMILNYGFDIVRNLNFVMTNDFKLLNKQNSSNQFELLGNADDISTGKNIAVIGKTYIDTNSGPVYIDDNVTFKGINFIEGPCYIGKNSVVDSAKIRPNCSFGRVNKISGEIEHSLFLDYVNKHHDGFIGHSILGDWVNLGALSTNSDLKNNYHNVRMLINGKTIDTGMLKMGALVGDYSKTGIGTLINTGAVIGVCCNIFGGTVTDKYYPSFSWQNGNITYSIDKAIDTIRITMSRRGIELSERDIKTLKNIFEKERG